MAQVDDQGGAEIGIETGHDETGAPVLTLSGELDISNASSLEAVVSSVLVEHSDRLTFDLSALKFMDSAGIAVLIGAAGKVEHVRLRNPSPTVRRVVEITGLSPVLQIEP